MRHVTGPAAQVRHERRRQGEDINLAQQLRHQKRRGGEDVNLAQQVRHQRRRGGQDLNLAALPDSPSRLLRIRRQGGGSYNLDQTFPRDLRLLRVKKEGGGSTNLSRTNPRDLRLLRVRKEGGGGTNLARLKAMGGPRSHVLGRGPGDLILARWNVSNLGTAPGRCHLDILDLSTAKILASGITVQIDAGISNVGLLVSWTIPSSYPSGSHPLRLVMIDTTPSVPNIIANHDWTLNTGSNLVASSAPGQPSIT